MKEFFDVIPGPAWALIGVLLTLLHNDRVRRLDRQEVRRDRDQDVRLEERATRKRLYVEILAAAGSAARAQLDVNNYLAQSLGDYNAAKRSEVYNAMSTRVARERDRFDSLCQDARLLIADPAFTESLRAISGAPWAIINARTDAERETALSEFHEAREAFAANARRDLERYDRA